MKNIDRRGFLRTGIAGAAGFVALSPSLVSADSPVPPQDIIYRTLGKTGMKVPVLALGL